MVMRITGLSSGMDIESMISKLMQAERMPLDNLKKLKTKNEWLQDSYRSMNTNIYTIREHAKQIQYNSDWPSQSGTDGSGNPAYTQEDKDAIYAKINSFVTVYNDTSVAIKSKIDERVERAYQPLSSDEKKAMSGDDVTTWEQKAKKGLLARDSILTEGYNDLRTNVTTAIDGLTTYTSLTDIGVTTGAYDKSNPATAGKLYIDSNKLKAAIDANPQAVIDMFTVHGTGNSRGIAQRIYEDTGDVMSEISNKAGSSNGSYTSVNTTLGRQDFNIDAKILKLTDLINKREDRYYKMFSAMESAIAKGNSQMSWLQSQFG